MKSLISSAKKISFDCRVQIRRYELKKTKDGKKVERDRQTDRQRNRDRDRERINFQIKKKKIQSSSPSKSTWVTKRNIRSTQADVSNIFEYT